jgi:hypothetical protein
MVVCIVDDVVNATVPRRIARAATNQAIALYPRLLRHPVFLP